MKLFLNVTIIIMKILVIPIITVQMIVEVYLYFLLVGIKNVKLIVLTLVIKNIIMIQIIKNALIVVKEGVNHSRIQFKLLLPKNVYLHVLQINIIIMIQIFVFQLVKMEVMINYIMQMEDIYAILPA